MKSGIVIINKEKGWTSQDVVSKVKRILNEKKAGHIGTLDPLATGVLPVLIGSGTKVSKYLMEHDKQYIATIKLSQKRDTGDEEGKIIEEKEVPFLEKENIEKILKSFLGKQKQAPHMYSAVKINGKKLYEYARQGQQIEIPTRDIEIYAIELINIDNENQEITYNVSVSKGTYIRVLCEDIAEKLGTVGYMKELKRTKVDNFDIANSVKLQNLSEKNIISIEEIFKNYPKVDLNDKKLELFLNGVQLTFELNDGIYRVYNKNNFIGLGVVKNKSIKRDVVIEQIGTPINMSQIVLTY